jgi:serine/threonine protein phosphatase PrpC
MEDEVLVDNGGRFAAVFDGHGGSGVSTFLERHLYERVKVALREKHWEVDAVDAGTRVGIVNKEIALQQDTTAPSVASYVLALRAAFANAQDGMFPLTVS